METEIYRYRISRRQVAFRLLLSIAVAWCWIFALLALGVPPEAEALQWGARGMAAVSVILLAVATWNLRHPATFEVILTRKRLVVRYPGEQRLSLDVAVADISHIELCVEGSPGGWHDDRHWLVLRNGERLHLTTNYFHPAHRLHRALQAIDGRIAYRRVGVRRTG